MTPTPAPPVAAGHRRVADTALLAAWRAATRLPEGAVGPALAATADALWLRRGQGVRRLESNLARIAPDDDPRALSRRAMRSYLRYWGEVFRLPRWSTADRVARVRPDRPELLLDAYAQGRGVVAALPHQGNWDLAGAWACGVGVPLTTVAERLRPEALYDEFVAFREGIGMEVVPLTGGPRVVPLLLRRLRAGAFVPLMADRDLSGSGVEVDLVGHRARLAGGPAMLARRTGAVLLPITTAYDPDGAMRLHFHDPVEHLPGPDGLMAMTQAVADAFSVALRRDPADWHMLQRVFAADLDAHVGTAAPVAPPEP